MSNLISPEQNFPIDEIQRRIAYIYNKRFYITANAREIQNKLTFSHTLTDLEEKNILDKSDEYLGNVLIQLIMGEFPYDYVTCESCNDISGKSEYRWVIDPIDGAMNFARNIPLYSVSLGIQHRGVNVGGIVILPEFNEIYSAVYGEGAYKNNKRIKVSEVNCLERALLVSSFPNNRKFIPREMLAEVSAFVTSGRSIRRTGSVILDLCWLAEGRVDGLWDKDIKDIDMAATSVIIREAGGSLSDFQGSSVLILPGNIIATNGLIHKQIVELIKKSREELTLN